VKCEGRTLQGRYLKVGVAFTDDVSPAKIGIITIRRVGEASARNRIRRRLREIFRLMRPSIVPGAWIVIVARPPAATATSADLREEWLRLAARLSIVPAPQ